MCIVFAVSSESAKYIKPKGCVVNCLVFSFSNDSRLNKKSLPRKIIFLMLEIGIRYFHKELFHCIKYFFALFNCRLSKVDPLTDTVMYST